MHSVEKALPFLDPAMVLRVLDFAEKSGRKVGEARAQLIRSSKMFDEIEKLGDENQNLAQSRAAFTAEVERLKELAAPAITAFFSRNDSGLKCDVDRELSQDLLNRKNVTEQTIDAIVALVSLQHSAGMYDEAYELARFASYVIDRENTAARTKILWARAATLIMSKRYWHERNGEDVFKLLSEVIVEKHDRLWFLHWMLFYAFEGNRSWSLLQLFKQQRDFRAVVESEAPHIVTYILFASLNDREVNDAKGHQYLLDMIANSGLSNAMTAFVTAMWQQYDLKRAGSLISEIEKIIDGDFFLAPVKDKFIRDARRVVIEASVRTHKRISIERLAAMVSMPVGEAVDVIAKLLDNPNITGEINTVENVVTIESTKAKADTESIVEELRGIHKLVADV